MGLYKTEKLQVCILTMFYTLGVFRKGIFELSFDPTPVVIFRVYCISPVTLAIFPCAWNVCGVLHEKSCSRDLGHNPFCAYFVLPSGQASIHMFPYLNIFEHIKPPVRLLGVLYTKRQGL